MNTQQLYMKPESDVDLNFMYMEQSYRIHVNSHSGIIIISQLVDNGEPINISITLLKTLTPETDNAIIKAETKEKEL